LHTPQNLKWQTRAFSPKDYKFWIFLKLEELLSLGLRALFLSLTSCGVANKY
jgi:hypothetical protein